MKNRTYNLVIPDFLNVQESTYFITTFREHREIFNDNIIIKGLLGSFQFSNWNKDNKQYRKYAKLFGLDTLYKLSDKYKSLNLSLYIVFDKEKISNKDLNDEYCNSLMKVFNDSRNYVIVSSDILSNYIKETYSNINVINYNNIDDNLVIIDNNIPDRTFTFKHNKNDVKLDKIDVKKNLYYNKNGIKDYYEIDTNSYYESLKDYDDNKDTFIIKGLGVYNIASYINVINYLYKEEYRYDALIQIVNGILIYKKHEVNAIMNYRL